MNERTLSHRAGKIALPLTDEWRRRVRVALARVGHNQSWLAEQIGCSRQAVHEALTTGRTSTLRVVIDGLLGLPQVIDPTTALPTTAHQGDAAHLLAELLTAWNALTPANRVRLVERATALQETQ